MIKRNCKLLAGAALLSLSALHAFAADPPPTTIAPDYSLNQTMPAASRKPKDIGQLRQLVTSVLDPGDTVDATAYYVVNRLDYDAATQVFRDGGWYIYYQGWDSINALAWLDDPLIKGNYRRARIYGSDNLRLMPVIALPTADFSKLDDAGIRAFEIQAARQIASGTGALTGALTDPATLETLIGGWRNRQVTPAERADLSALLPAAQPVPRQGNVEVPVIDVASGDRLQTVPPKSLGAANLPAAQLALLRKLSAFVVREALTAYIQGSVPGVTDIATITWKRKGGINEGANLAGVAGKPGLYYYPAFTSNNDLPQYRITVAARQPQPSADLAALTGLIGGHGAPMVFLQIDTNDRAFQKLLSGDFVADIANEAVHVGALPVDMTIEALPPASSNAKTGGGGGAAAGAGTSNKDSTAISSIKVQNEKRYFYGVGVGLPLKSWDAVEYDSTNSLITAKKVEKQNVFGFIEFHPYPTNTAGTRFRLLPTLMAGLPIAGKVLNQQIYAGNLGFWKVEVFAGVLVHRDLVPAPGAAANTAPGVAGTDGSLHARWGTRLTYGINVPISVIQSALSSKSSSGASATSSGGAGSSKKSTSNASGAP